MSYGTGAIMAVPAHDSRDWDFAKKYGINMIRVIDGGDISKEAFTDCSSGTLINSDFINGLTVDKAKEKVVNWLEKNKIGEHKVNYKLRD